MKQNLKMLWFMRSSRRKTLLKRKVLLQLFSNTNLHLAVASGGTGYLNIKDRKPGDFFELSSSNITFNDTRTAGIDSILKEYITFKDDMYIYGLEVYGNDTNRTIVAVVLSDINTSPFKKFDFVILHKDDIENFTSTTPIATTYGRYLQNYFAIASVIGDRIPFINDHWNISKVETKYGQLLRYGEITTVQARKYVDCIYFLSSLTEVFATMITEKSIVPPKAVENRRKELYAQYGRNITDPNIMLKVEDELISIDKAAIADDSSMDFYGDSGAKFVTHRKRMNVAIGMLETFEKTKGKYDFIPEPLYEGWNVDSFIPMFNEIRKGSYERGISTAKGGLTTKEMARCFQNSKITGEDCHTKRTLNVILTEALVPEFMGQNIMVSPDRYVTLTEKNASLFIGKEVKLRSMMYCVQPDGYCYTCAGTVYKDINSPNIGTVPIDLGALFIMLPMKAMHGTKISSFDLNDLDKYVV